MKMPDANLLADEYVQLALKSDTDNIMAIVRILAKKYNAKPKSMHRKLYYVLPILKPSDLRLEQLLDEWDDIRHSILKYKRTRKHIIKIIPKKKIPRGFIY